MSYYIIINLVSKGNKVDQRTNIALMHQLNHIRSHRDQSVGFMVTDAESWTWIFRGIIVLHVEREVWRSGGGGFKLGMWPTGSA
jgi:hypothetical protein